MTGSEFANAPLLSLTTRMQRSTAHQWQASVREQFSNRNSNSGRGNIDANDEWKRRKMQEARTSKDGTNPCIISKYRRQTKLIPA
jgi:hypothetical protein